MQSWYFTIDEASTYTGIKKSTLYAKVEQREIPHYRIRRSIKFKRDDLDAWMEAHRVECVDATEEARRILSNTRRSKVDIDSLIKKTVAESKATEYLYPTRDQTESGASERRKAMGLYKRGQVWHMDFVYKGKRYRKSTETADRKLAKRIYDKVKGEVAEGKWFERLPGEDKLFTEMMDKYLLEHASLKVSARSFRGYAKRLSSFFGSHTLVEITPSLVNEYKIQRRNDGVKPTTINRELATMKKAFNLALKEWQWVKDNPVSKVSMEKEDNRRDRWLMWDEEGELLEACEFWLREMVVFALNTGMRLSEILGLTWKGVDLFRRTLTVFKSKNGDKRTIPMNATVFEMLKDKAKVRSIKTDLVFPSQAFSIIDKCNVGKAFRLAVKKSKIEDFRFHDLRHTFATRLVQAGKDLYQVQSLLGHKSPAMTQRYARHYPESLRDAVEVLDRHEELSHKKDTINEKGVNPGRLTP